MNDFYKWIVSAIVTFLGIGILIVLVCYPDLIIYILGGVFSLGIIAVVKEIIYD